MSSASSAPAGPSAAAIAAICGAEILGLAGYSTVPALLPQFIEAWSLTNTQAGWLAGIVSAGYMLAVVPIVSLIDRRPARLIYLASCSAHCPVLASRCATVCCRRLNSGASLASRSPACVCRACRRSLMESRGQGVRE